MALQDMKVYETEIQTTTIELLGQKINDFVSASGGAFQINMDAWRGDFSNTAFFNQIAAAKRRVDRYAVNGAVTPTPLTQGEFGGVKVAGGFGPVLFEESQMTYLSLNPDAAIMAISEGFANALLADQINTGLTAGVAAVSGQAALINDVSGTTGAAGTLAQSVLNGSHAKFGDMSGILRTDFMTGAAYHELINKGLANGERLFEAGNVTVQSILNKLVVVTDSPALVDKDKYRVLSVAQGGIIVDNTGDIITNLERSNGKGRIETTWQADYTFGVQLMGYKWDEANGGRSPNDATLATPTNWDKAVAEDKHTLGTLAIANIVATV